ncbi:MAG: hypothetical protein H5U01_02270 [Clostridia bacterium]|nr:hypothetical protein [Clostridia bacterium]MBC7346056.1 hypothetical protein [Clostridia bacterium]
MVRVAEVGRCAGCGKLFRRRKIQPVPDALELRTLCPKCYQRYQRLQWGYW